MEEEREREGTSSVCEQGNVFVRAVSRDDRRPVVAAGLTAPPRPATPHWNGIALPLLAPGRRAAPYVTHTLTHTQSRVRLIVADYFMAP